MKYDKIIKVNDYENIIYFSLLRFILQGLLTSKNKQMAMIRFLV